MNKGLKFLLSQEVLGSIIVIIISIIIFMFIKDATLSYINKKKKMLVKIRRRDYLYCIF